MRLPLIVATALIVAGSASAATVNIQFSSGTSTIATGFADASGNAAPGLVWGIIISNGDNTFSPITPGFVLNATTGTGTDGVRIGSTNDYFFGSGTLTSTQGPGGEAGVLGKISQVTNITLGPGATTGAQFAIVWFDRTINSITGTVTAGTQYGLLTDPSFIVPAGGNTLSLADTYFASAGDPVKSANTVTVVPEPSTALLGAVGALGLLRRRRN
jgi:hypothetical protein